MNLFGIIRLSLDISVSLIVIFAVSFIVISFVLSRKIKKIELYKLLIGE